MTEATTPPSHEHRLAPVITWRSSLVASLDCSTCKLVGLVLSLYMNERGGSAFPSNQTLARDCSLSISTVREHLNTHLHAHGWLTLIERGGSFTGTKKSNEWQAATPPGTGGVPHRENSAPHRETASTPPGDGAQVVHVPVQEISDLPAAQCEACGVAFLNGADEMAHLDECPEIERDPEGVKAEFVAARESLRPRGKAS